jgi:deoxyribodipyrimidine photo-lyase
VSGGPVLVWFRHDLRLSDHPALAEAARSGRAVLPVYVWAPEDEGAWPPGAASRWWLHHSLEALDTSLRRRGSRLVLRSGPADRVLAELAAETGAELVAWSRRYEPHARVQEERVASALRRAGVATADHPGHLLAEPSDVVSGQGSFYRVFTPFWKALRARPDPPAPLAPPRRLAAPRRWPQGLPLAALELLPDVDWAGGLRERWVPGEPGAQQRLDELVASRLGTYGEERDRLDRPAISELSPHLHFGEIGPRQVWHAVRRASAQHPSWGRSAEAYLRQLAWREFGHHLLVHVPHLPERPYRDEFAAFPWRDDERGLRAWQRGRTGYPLVDAAMRELWRTGFVHNRARLVVASFLTKHLLVPWQRGARWFWDTLVDADLANNSLGWQWTAGCGPDAAPYFRVFNPALQARRFDPHGRYVRDWLPSLRALEPPALHDPATAPPLVLEAAGIRLGRTYPRPIVDHRSGRDRALAAYDQVRKRSRGGA